MKKQYFFHKKAFDIFYRYALNTTHIALHRCLGTFCNENSSKILYQIAITLDNQGVYSAIAIMDFDYILESIEND